MSVYLDFNGFWIGYYRDRQYHFLCLIPMLVVRWDRAGTHLDLR